MTNKAGKLSPSAPSNAAVSTRSKIDDFLAKVGGTSAAKAGSDGRLIFVLDATASRQPTWDTACHLQAEMFKEAAAVGGLSVQLGYYRDTSECKFSGWKLHADELSGLMERIDCRAGHTQIRKVLAHAVRETRILRVQALVFVGDAMEENPDDLGHHAGELGQLGVPAFMFQEGRDHEVESVFREVARLSGGAYCRFNTGAARQLAELLRAVAVYAAGGVLALADLRESSAAKALLKQIR